MFAVCPRYTDDDLSLFQLADELATPWNYGAPKRVRNLAAVAGRESEVHNTDKEWRVRLDLQHYKPEEVKITSDNNRITISAKHEEKQDKHGYVSREMTRTYKLPEDVDPKSVTSSMNANGALSIKAAKKAIEAPKETPIPIAFKN